MRFGWGAPAPPAPTRAREETPKGGDLGEVEADETQRTGSGATLRGTWWANKGGSTMASSKVARVGIVGSGPAGFYAADQLLQRLGGAVRVDIYEKLPTPFGLVRSGVAPDHPDTKSCVHKFASVAQDERVRFFGNVLVGRELPLKALQECYHALVLAYGAEDDRRLGVSGEHLAGVHAAREFVWWYNGHTDFRHLPIRLDAGEDVTIFGQGNVAVDCARVLLKPWQSLQNTDIARHALEELQESRVSRVHLVGRRGPAHASFTPKELRELLQLDGVSVHIRQEDLQLTPVDEAILRSNRIRRRAYETLVKLAQERSGRDLESAKQLHIRFYRSPTAFAGSEGRVQEVHTEINAVHGDPPRAVGTGAHETMPCALALRSIGYVARPLDGVPFDLRRGVVPNEHGRVVLESVPVPGLYVCGWLRRGASGIIGTNLTDAQEVASCLAQDFVDGRLPIPLSESDVVPTMLRSHGVRAVDFSGWQRIDVEEQHRGRTRGKPREKLVDVDEMLHVAGSG